MAIILLCSPAQLLGLISIGAVFALRGFHVRLSAMFPELSTIDVMFTISDLLSVRFKLASGTTRCGSGLFLYLSTVRVIFLFIMIGCRFIWILTEGKEVIVKVKVKFYLSPVCNLLKRGRLSMDCRSCGVVRSIMSDSRSVDPGSNPGTSTKTFRLTHYSHKSTFVRVVRSYANRA